MVLGLLRFAEALDNLAYFVTSPLLRCRNRCRQQKQRKNQSYGYHVKPINRAAMPDQNEELHPGFVDRRGDGLADLCAGAKDTG